MSKFIKIVKKKIKYVLNKFLKRKSKDNKPDQMYPLW